jgi:hemolysin E
LIFFPGYTTSFFKVSNQTRKENSLASMTTLAEAKAAIEITEQGIEAMRKAMKLYDEIMDKIIPWNTFKDTVDTLLSFEADYSEEAYGYVKQAKLLIESSRDNYIASTRSVYEWCSLAVSLLKAYIKLLDQRTSADSQKKLIIRVLDEGHAKMTTAIELLNSTNSYFNSLKVELEGLNRQLGSDFDRRSAWFDTQVDKIRKEAYGGAAAGAIGGPIGLMISYSIAAGVVEGKLIPELESKLKGVKERFSKLQTTVTDTVSEIATSKTKLVKEVSVISTIRTQVETVKVFVDINEEALYDELKSDVQKLINLCTNYQQKHEEGKE